MELTLSNFIYYIWPWIGLGGAIAIVILLFCTDFLRVDMSKSRWKDPAWLAWLASAAYLIHNCEEYGIDMLGNLHQFPTTMLDMMSTTPPEAFYMAVNISMFWIVSPIAAVIGRKHKIVAMGMAGELFINALSHVAPLLGGTGYTAGTLTAIIIFLPVSIWTFCSCYGKSEGKLSFKVLATIIAIAIVNHLLLMVSIMMLKNGVVGNNGVVVFQIVNSALALIMWLGADKLLSKN